MTDSQESTPIDFPLLWDTITARYHGGLYSIHGPAHWRRVEQNGLLLAQRSGADVIVVKLFALFHDSMRINEGTDNGHGARGAIYAAELRGKLFTLDDARFALLSEACIGHTDKDHSDNPTVGTCWDADRLDLGRVGIIPDQAYMSTDFGKEIARAGSIYSFLPK